MNYTVNYIDPAFPHFDGLPCNCPLCEARRLELRVATEAEERRIRERDDELARHMQRMNEQEL